LSFATAATLADTNSMFLDTDAPYRFAASAAALAFTAALLWVVRTPLVGATLIAGAAYVATDTIHAAAHIDQWEWVQTGVALATLALALVLDRRGARAWATYPWNFGGAWLLVVVGFAFDSLDLWWGGVVLSGLLLMSAGAVVARVSLVVLGGIAIWIALTCIDLNLVTIVTSTIAAVVLAVIAAVNRERVDDWIRRRQ
jgi:hypothetical protein